MNETPTTRAVSRQDLEEKLFSGYADIDAGPTKAELVEKQAAFPKQFAGATGKRPAVEL